MSNRKREWEQMRGPVERSRSYPEVDEQIPGMIIYTNYLVANLPTYGFGSCGSDQLLEGADRQRLLDDEHALR